MQDVLVDQVPWSYGGLWEVGGGGGGCMADGIGVWLSCIEDVGRRHFWPTG